jgi:transcriptional regulator with XRE-family HTH domain
MKDRILRFLREEQISASRFADEIGVQRSGISHILSGRNNPSLDLIQKILVRYDQINPDWLILGKGSMMRNSKEPTLFEASPVVQTNPDHEPVKEESPVSVSNPAKQDKKVDKIIIIYSDNTFSTLLPGE